jgi:hypothetical protein
LFALKQPFKARRLCVGFGAMKLAERAPAVGQEQPLGLAKLIPGQGC